MVNRRATPSKKKSAPRSSKRPSKRLSKKGPRTPAAGKKKPKRVVTLYGRGKLGRRTFLRASARRGLTVTIPRLGTYPGLDVGVYGLSFRAPREHASLLRKGAWLEGVEVTLEGRTFSADCRILHSRPYPGRGSELKVGLEFVRIDPEEIWNLSTYVVLKRKLGKPLDIEVKLTGRGARGARGKKRR